MGKKSARKKERKAAKAGSDKKTAAVKPDTFMEMDRRFRELEHRLDNVFSDNWGFPSRWELPDWSRLYKVKLAAPRIDIVDRDDDILVRADVPGYNKDGLEVSFTDNTISIRGSTSEAKKEEKGDYYRNETMKGAFTRTVYLPSEVDGSQASSTYTDGVLEVLVPKLGKARRVKVDVS
jgi:HSP20 family protein